MKQKKPILIITFSSILLLICLLLLYTTRINVFQKTSIRVTQNGNNIYSGIEIKGIKPLGGVSVIEKKTNETSWNTGESYYNKIILTFNKNLNISKDTIKIYFYDSSTGILIRSFNNPVIFRDQVTIKTLGEKNVFAIAIMVLKPFYGIIISLFAFIISFVLLGFIKNKKHIKYLIYSLSFAIFIWGFFWLFVASYFCFPNAEDLSLVLKSRESGIVGGALQLLLSYDGRYFTNILHGINPMAFGGVHFYKLYPIISLLFVTSSVFFFFKTVFRGSISKSNLFFASAIFVIIHFATIPSIVHDLYWMVSSIVYLYAVIFFLLWVSFFIKHINAKHQVIKTVYFFIAALLMICSYGINEMMLIINSFTLLIFAIYVIRYKRTELHSIIGVFIIAGCCIFLFISSPGIIHRYKSFGIEKNQSYFISLMSAGTRQFFYTLFVWIFQKPIIISIVLCVTILLSRIYEKLIFVITKKEMILLFFGGIIIIYLSVYSYYLPMGADVYPERVYNFINWFFLFIIAFLTPLILVHFKITKIHRFKKNQDKILVSLLIFVFVQILSTQNNIDIIRHEFQNGLLNNYNNEMENRYQIIEQSKTALHWKVAIIDPIKSKPKSIFSPPDILPNREDSYWNLAYEGYFMVDEVKLKGDTISKLKLLSEYEY